MRFRLDPLSPTGLSIVNPQVTMVSSTTATAAAGSGTVDSVVAGNNIDVDATDPANPIVSVETLVAADISDVTSSATELNVLDGIPATLTATELGYSDGVTSAIQTQLNAKAADADVVHDTGNETVAGVKTFTDIPVISGANGDISISADTDGREFNIATSASGTLAIYGSAGNILNVELLDGALSVASNITTQGYVKIDSTPAPDHTGKGIVAEFVANEAQAIGDVCYIDSAGEMALADADAIATSVVVGMCIDATVAADATGNYLLSGIARDDTWTWTVGGPIYLSTTGTSGNTLTQTAPSGTDDCVVVVGVATHADRMLFNPSAQGIVEVV